MIIIEDTDIDLMDPELVSLRNRAAAHASWVKRSRDNIGAQLYAAQIRKIEEEIDPDGKMPPEELAKRVKSRMSEKKARAAYEGAKKKRKAAAQSAGTDRTASKSPTRTVTTRQESQ